MNQDELVAFLEREEEIAQAKVDAYSEVLTFINDFSEETSFERASAPAQVKRHYKKRKHSVKAVHKTVLKECPACGTQFEPKSNSQRFCSRKCQQGGDDGEVQS